MKFQQAKIELRYLILSAVCLAIALGIFELGKKRLPTLFYDQQVAAANLMRQCLDSLSDIQFSEENFENDPNRTHLIGVEYSSITTTPGDLIAKRTSTNPDFAALLVRWFHDVKLNSGDVVAVGCSGSFPALILATLCAAEACHLQPIMIPSLGASSFGANRPDFTYLDMENFLFQKGLIHHRSAAASVGGAEDVGTDLSPEGRDILEKTIVRHKIELIAQKNIEANVFIRGRVYLSKGLPKVFINIGGAQINIGDYDSERRLAPGINKLTLGANRAPHSMIEYFVQHGIPIIHLLKIQRLALEYNLPIDPTPLLEPGFSVVYFVERIDIGFLIAACVCFLGSVVCLFWNKKIFGASPVGEATGKDMQAS